MNSGKNPYNVFLIVPLLFLWIITSGQTNHGRDSTSESNEVIRTYYMGEDFFDSEEYDVAVEQFLTADSLYKNLPDSIKNSLSWYVPFFINYKLGETLLEINDYLRAEEYLQAAINVFKKHNPEDVTNELLCTAYNNLIFAFQRQEKTGWVDFYTPSLILCDNPSDKSSGYLLQFDYFLKGGAYENAHKSLLRISEIIASSSQKEINPSQVALLKMNKVILSEVYPKSGSFIDEYEELKRFCFSEGLAVGKKMYIQMLHILQTYGIKHGLNWDVYREANEKLLKEIVHFDSYNSSYILMTKYLGLVAEERYDEAEKLIYNILDKNADGRITLSDWELSAIKEIFIKMYEDLLHIEHQRVTKNVNPSSIDSILPFIDRYYQFSDLYMEYSHLTISRLYYLNYFEKSFSDIKEILLYHYHRAPQRFSLQDLWQYHEKMRGNLFSFLLKEQIAFNNAELTSSQQTYFNQLKKRIITHQNAIRESNSYEVMRENKYLLNQATKSIDSLLKSLIKPTMRSHSLSELLSESMDYNRRHNTVTLQYSVSHNYLYTFIITRDNLAMEVRKINKDSLSLRLDSYRKLLKKGDHYALSKVKFRERLKNFQAESHELYKIFLAPYEAYLNFKVRINPDPIMMGIPFETLCIKKNLENHSYADLEYAIKRYTFHYYSINPTSKRDVPLEKTKCILSIIPDYKDNPQYNYLGSRIHEYAYFKDMPNTTIWTGEKASPEYILKNWQNYAVINFTGHATSERDNLTSPYLLLNKDKNNNSRVFTDDIQYDNLNAKLIFLNACSTQGEIHHFTEGLLGLQRVFLLSNTQSIISTLWPVRDRESAELTRLTYNNIKKGYLLDEALREAKLSFLTNKNPISSIPYFWAAHTLNGNILHPSEIFCKPRRNYTSILIASILAAGFSIIFIMRGRKKKVKGIKNA